MKIVICGTGPSINNLDREKLKKLPTLGINQFFIYGLQTTYYYVYDKRCITQEKPNFLSVIPKWKNTTFFVDESIILDQVYTNVKKVKSISLKIHEVSYKWWAQTLDEPLMIHKGTMTGAINLAYVLGYDEIYLAGFDGFGGYFYPHKKNRFKNRLHDSLIYDKNYGNISSTIKKITEWLNNLNVEIYNINQNSFYVKRHLMEYKKL